MSVRKKLSSRETTKYPVLSTRLNSIVCVLIALGR